MKNIAVCIMAAWWFAACGNPVTSPERVDEWPDIYPDYIGVTIPATIAPMNFNCIGGAYECGCDRDRRKVRRDACK